MQKTACCGYEFKDDCPVMWNEYNGVVQCHHCGLVWNPARASEDYHPNLDGPAEPIGIASDTPRTDEAQCKFGGTSSDASLERVYADCLDFARQLERELASGRPREGKAHVSCTPEAWPYCGR